MADQVGCSDSEMQAAVQNFNARYQEFEAASQNINQDIQSLAQEWVGSGYDSFATAMGKWSVDMDKVNHDLSSMSKGVQQSSEVIYGSDGNIAKAFAQFHG